MWQPAERIRHSLPVVSWPDGQAAASSRLFSPVKIGSLVATSRTWVPAMVPWRATAEGYVTDAVIDWYRRFASGKPGVIVVEATGIRDIPSGPLLRIGDDRFTDGLSRLSSAVKEASGGETKLFIQLIDFLRIRRRPQREKYFQRFLAISPAHRSRMSDSLGESWAERPEEEVRDRLACASDAELESILDERELESLLRGDRERVSDTHLSHVAELPQVLPTLFADAAERAFESGFDGVELHYAHAYTMASFLSKRNGRDDGYGGTREGRVRLPLEVIAAVRERVGGERVVGLRFLGDEVIDGGSDLDDAIYYARQFAASPIDFISVSKGGKFEDAKQPRVGEAVYPYTGRSGYECMPTVFSDAVGPFGRNVPLAAAIKLAINRDGHEQPVVSAGGVSTFELAESILETDQADIIAAARQSLADPDWWLKMRSGRGAEIRRCEFTNYCEGLDQKHKQVTCKLWDRKELDEAGLVKDDTGQAPFGRAEMADTGGPLNLFVTALGCRLNEAEVDSWHRELTERGHHLASEPEDADIAIINTCAVTAEASRKSRKLVGSIHRRNPSAKIVATGCYATLSADEAGLLPGVDLVVGNDKKEELIEVASRELALPTMPQAAAEPTSDHAFNEVRTRGFIKVQDGCRNRCTFCIVTIARGAERSRSVDEIVREVELMVSRGFEEVVLTGVHLGGYGSDIGVDLRDLVRAVLNRTDISRLRLSSLEPWDLPDDFWQLWRDPRLMPHLHLPLQSGSNAVLKRMARRCPTDQYRALVGVLRDHVPELMLTTDVIVGFPGETDEEWSQTLSFVEEIGFSHVHIFSYSRREGTGAARLPNHLPRDVKRQRSQELHHLAADMKRKHESAMVGRECEVLWEGDGTIVGEHVRYEGYTHNYLRVRTELAPGSPPLQNRIERVALEHAMDDGRTRLRARRPLA